MYLTISIAAIPQISGATESSAVLVDLFLFILFFQSRRFFEINYGASIPENYYYVNWTAMISLNRGENEWRHYGAVIRPAKRNTGGTLRWLKKSSKEPMSPELDGHACL